LVEVRLGNIRDGERSNIAVHARLRVDVAPNDRAFPNLRRVCRYRLARAVLDYEADTRSFRGTRVGGTPVAKKLVGRPPKPGAPESAPTYQVLCYTHDSTESLLDAFQQVRKTRKAVGTPTDEEQDLLRAMLVFSSAGLDAVAKQLIRDCLLLLVDRSQGVREAFQNYVEKRIRGRGEDSAAAGVFDAKFIASAMLAHDATTHLVDVLAADLTSGSLQSVDELKRVAVFLAADPEDIEKNRPSFQAAFHARNQIIHEMDVDFTMKNRNR
jgi:hypothetical protein